MQNAAKATTNLRSYWNMLQKTKQIIPLRLHDPDDPKTVNEDPVEINRKLTNYWSIFGIFPENKTDGGISPRMN